MSAPTSSPGTAHRNGTESPLLAAENVTMRFGDVVALESLDLQVPRGEFLVVVGASGCGKSTLLNLWAGFEQPTSGRVTLQGERIDSIEPRCGMVFQSYALFPWLTVAQNIGFGPKMGPRATRAEADPKRVQALIDTVGIGGFENHYPAQLSGGMRQRVALARTLANDPEVLLCDEPFAALDAMTRQVLQEELARVARAEQKTVVFITHSIDEALLLGDRIVVLSARPGRVKLDMRNDLGRPRTAELQLTKAYLDLKREIWESVRAEVELSVTMPRDR